MASKWIVPAVVLVLALTGCASQTPEQAYLSTVRESVPDLADAADDDLIAVGQGVCSAFDEQGFEAGMVTFIGQTKDAGFNAKDAGAIAGAATGAYCPEYSGNF